MTTTIAHYSQTFALGYLITIAHYSQTFTLGYCRASYGSQKYECMQVMHSSE